MKRTILLIFIMVCWLVLQSEIKTQPVNISGFTYLGKKTYLCGGQMHSVKEYRHNQTNIEFVLIPGGTFIMGNNYGNIDERPAHEVTLSPYLMAKTEVTQAIWKRIMGNNPSCTNWAFGPPDAEQPVDSVSWNDCQDFCEKTGLELPTEAQWEYACRAGTQSKYYWGDSMDGKYCWWYENSTGDPINIVGNDLGDQTHWVATKNPNAFGLYDMIGNVWEWCRDIKGTYSSEAQKNPVNTSAVEAHGFVVRGGGFNTKEVQLHSTRRVALAPHIKNNSVGFRPCARINQ